MPQLRSSSTLLTIIAVAGVCAMVALLIWYITSQRAASARDHTVVAKETVAGGSLHFFVDHECFAIDARHKCTDTHYRSAASRRPDDYRLRLANGKVEHVYEDAWDEIPVGYVLRSTKYIRQSSKPVVVPYGEWHRTRAAAQSDVERLRKNGEQDFTQEDVNDLAAARR
jgi:hypothetical protein